MGPKGKISSSGVVDENDLHCPHCKSPLGKADIHWQACFACEHDLWDMLSALEEEGTSNAWDPEEYEGIFVPCPGCNEWIEFGDIECEHCHARYSEIDWRAFYNEHPELIFEEEDIDLLGEDLGLDYNLNKLNIGTMLCCNLEENECGCDQPVFWRDTNDIDQEIDALAYDTTSPCATCAYYFSPKCIPYRNLLRKYLLGNELDEPITGCQNFDNNINNKDAFTYE